MPTNEQLAMVRPGTHFFAPVSETVVRTSDPEAPKSGFITYPFLNSTAGTVEARIIFAGGTPQVWASST